MADNDALRYRAERGSRVEISGKHRGICRVELDWFEEDARALRRIQLSDAEPMLYWQCECHGHGQARLDRE